MGACLLISTCSHLLPWIHVVLASGAAQKNKLSRDQLHRPWWFQGSLPRTGSPTSSSQLLWRATFQAPWQSSQVSGQHGTLSGKLSFWRGTRLNPDSINSVFEGNPKFLLYLVSFTVAISVLQESILYFCFCQYGLVVNPPQILREDWSATSQGG